MATRSTLLGRWVKLLLLGVGLWGLPHVGSPSEGVSYVYDELGRLVGAVDPAGDSVVYTYDAVGNLLSISRQSSSRPSILDFKPKTGSAGTIVTLQGTGFGDTVSGVTAKFNGAPAPIISVSSRLIVVQVPVGATTGPIAVQAPAGSANTGQPFTVAATIGAPILTDFSPTIGLAGTVVTLNGRGFEPVRYNNLVTFQQSRATPRTAVTNALTVSVPLGTTSGRISVATPFGIGESANTFFVPPNPFTPNDVVFTGHLTNDSGLRVTIGAANKIALVAVDGIQGTGVVLRMNAVTLPQSDISVFNPDGTRLISVARVGPAGGAITLPRFPQTGTYTILVDPLGVSTGALTLSLGAADLLPTMLVIPNPLVPNADGTFTFTAVWTVKNAGSLPAKGGWLDVLIPSTSPTYCVGCITPGVARVLHAASLSAGDSYTAQARIDNLEIYPLPPFPQKPHYLVLYVDAPVGGNIIVEGNEANNILVVPMNLGQRSGAYP